GVPAAPTRRRSGAGPDPGRPAAGRPAPAAPLAARRRPVPAGRGGGGPAPHAHPRLVPPRAPRAAPGGDAGDEPQAPRLRPGGLARRLARLVPRGGPPRRPLLRPAPPCPGPLGGPGPGGDRAAGQPLHPPPAGVAPPAAAAGRGERDRGAA